ncbi:3-hydroxyisobutyryl-CoA hydrolase 1 isoform X1 [Rosa chinensis]|uniref:3-hydroxyisobutyryl-CoA hydrolase 1 isoform X1 n=2 Tax=Rosa chinensis TaxID=74649 RepID=UPI000D096462|nr:3-hydroxyisobutyryl-CoA hydrolase 1 isoform X1 [Rosa chinensis]
MASLNSTRRDDDDSVVLVREDFFARTLTLNRPRQLNALNFEMISRLLELFLAYEEDANVKLVILKGKGRAFCAGGDVAAVVRDINEGNWRLGAIFFRKEFTLNYLMATYSKPQVSILNGIVMGGGAGASIHGRFRVATENSVFAMPETALGLFPDVGASYYLSRLPGFFGEYVGLTGARLDGAEMLACGLATHFVPSTRLSSLEADLCKVDSSEFATIQAILDQYSQHPALKEKSAYYRMDVIDKCFSRRTVEEILSALEEEAAKRANDWLSTTIQSLKKASPMSLKISLRSIREGRLQGVGQCLVREYRMVSHVLRGEVSKDFREGCRAILLDKDRNPKWEPSKLELINDHMVEQYFSKLDDEEWEELKLPARFNLPVTAIAKL